MHNFILKDWYTGALVSIPSFILGFLSVYYLQRIKFLNASINSKHLLPCLDNLVVKKDNLALRNHHIMLRPV